MSEAVNVVDGPGAFWPAMLSINRLSVGVIFGLNGILRWRIIIICDVRERPFVAGYCSDLLFFVGYGGDFHEHAWHKFNSNRHAGWEVLAKIFGVDAVELFEERH